MASCEVFDPEPSVRQGSHKKPLRRVVERSFQRRVNREVSGSPWKKSSFDQTVFYPQSAKLSRKFDHFASHSDEFNRLFSRHSFSQVFSFLFDSSVNRYVFPRNFYFFFLSTFK